VIPRRTKSTPSLASVKMKVPDRWEAYSKVGKVVEGTSFVAFKVPLNQGVDNKWRVEDLMEAVPSLGLVIDLTFTAKYYDPKSLTASGIEHKKILTKGQQIPDKTVVVEFYTAVDVALAKGDDKLIGVHCTHGLNRTGYLVCRYMIEKLCMDPETAIAAFDEARGHKQERQNYIQHLKTKGWEVRLAATPPPVPPLPCVKLAGLIAINQIAIRVHCVPQWTLISETGPAHQKVFTWQLKLGEYMSIGSGPNKKIAKNNAADQMMDVLPEQWKKAGNKKNKKRQGDVENFQPPPKKKCGVKDYVMGLWITSDNPVSCLYEFAQKAKIPNPKFDCIEEKILETWQKGNQTFNKVEYTVQLAIDGKTYLAKSNTKKSAKSATATEAWNTIKAKLH